MERQHCEFNQKYMKNSEVGEIIFLYEFVT